MKSDALLGQGALITGSSRGIGAAIAVQLATLGAKVVINYAKDRSGAEQVAKTINDKGGTAYVIQANLGNPEQAKSLVTQAIGRLGRLDILVTNHGITPRAPLGDQSEDAFEVWDKNITVNLAGTFYCVNAAVEVMKAQKYGRIVCVSSGCAQRGCPGGVAYSTSKAGIHGMVHAAAREFAHLDLTINAVSPGLIDTAMTQAWDPGVREKLVARIPKGRFGTPDEIASAVVYLALPSTQFLTGQVISVNGGDYMSQ